LIDLKKKYLLRNLHYQQDNILAQHGLENIQNILKLIKIKFSKVLIIQPGIVKENKDFFEGNYKNINVEELEKETDKYDLIISNFALGFEIALEPEKYLKILNKLILKEGLLLMNILNDSSFRTLQKTFIEIDEFIFNGAHQRFGPFINTQTLIKNLDLHQFNEIVATNELLEVNYKDLKKLRSDLKTMGISNIISPKPKFNKEVLIKIRNIFKALLNNERFMPLEFEITTISSWK
jgi:galactitol-specific phosphotransferase system IIB component